MQVIYSTILKLGRKLSPQLYEYHLQKRVSYFTNDKLDVINIYIDSLALDFHFVHNDKEVLFYGISDKPFDDWELIYTF